MEISNKLKKEYKISHWRRISGDGNCFYRGVILQYIEFLILKCIETKETKYIEALIKDIISTMNSNTKDLEFEKTIYFLLCILDSLQSNNSFDPFNILYKTITTLSEIEMFLIFWLRIKLANFLTDNLDLETEDGFKMVETIPDIDLTSSEDQIKKYILNSLMEMDEFAEGYPIILTPLILQININVYSIDKQHGMNKFNSYPL